jgi:hypothetical protein
VGFGIQGSCGSRFKAHRVRGSRLVWFMALGSGCMLGSGLVGSGLGARGARSSEARGSWGSGFKAHRVRGSRLVWFMALGSGCMSGSGLGIFKGC